MKILFYDVETTPNQGWAWGKYQQNLLAFTRRRELLSFAYSYEGKSKVHCLTRQNQATDEKLVRQLHKLLQDADVVVAHNGDSFDNKVAKARMAYFGLEPLKILSTIDTKKAAYSFFMFDSNSLDDLAQYFKLGKKMPTPGFSLWQGCMEDEPKSWKTMVRYNKHDVTLLKAVYKRLRPWIQNHPNLGRLIDPYRNQLRCPYCTGVNLAARGFRVTNTRTYRRWVCLAPVCKGWFQLSIKETGKARK